MSSSYLQEPILEKKVMKRQGNDYKSTSVEMQGWRRNMEDALIFEELTKDVTLFAVCDGHGGPQVAQLISRLLPIFLKEDPDFVNQNYVQAFASTFKKLDDLICSQKGEEELKTLSKSIDGKTLKATDKIGYRAGSTCLALLLTKEKYIVANLGDSRAVLCRNHKAVALSTDHKPNTPSQKKRIQKAGGYVSRGRVNGSLSLSRALGDFELKKFSNRPYDRQAVICVPDVVEIDRQADDTFLMLGCDGVWQKYEHSNQNMVNHIESLIARDHSEGVMEDLFQDLVAKDRRSKWGFDNMSGILVEF